MKKLFFFFIISHLFCSSKPTIVLIHGFMGWGREEMGNYYYWGGFTDLQEYLRSEGYNVHTISVGPISSNWDRAIEAYYQIKGGQADYGVNHSIKYGLIQRPSDKVYDGILNEWDQDKPIHIITHSQGGQTARMLEYLLKTKFDNEDSDLLSNSKEGWIKSISTIACPHNGTILADEVSNHLSFLQKMTPFFGVLEESKINDLYNFDLSQWNLDKFDNESTTDYLNRLSSSGIKNSKNFSAWDLSIIGAEEFNDIYSTDSAVYYFSYPTYSTKELEDGSHVPDFNMTLMVWIPSLIIGKSSELSDEWHMNDGIVSTASMGYPINSSGVPEPYQSYDPKNIKKGVWQVMEPIHQDHHIIIGHRMINLDEENMKLFYKDICSRLYELD